MKRIVIADTTLCREEGNFTFKEKIEITRQLERLNVDRINLPEIRDARADTLLVRTISTFAGSSVLSVAAGMTRESVTLAAAALSAAKKPCIRIELPVSPVGMEYLCHKKPPKMLAWIAEIVAAAKAACAEVEFCAVDATRAEHDFLAEAIRAATENGASTVTVCDSAARLLPDDFAAFIGKIAADCAVPVGVWCDDRTGLAAAQAILAVRAGVTQVSTAVGGATVSLDGFAAMIKDCGENYGFYTGIRYTELHRIVGQIRWILGKENGESRKAPAVLTENTVRLDGKDDAQAVAAAVAALGYDLSEEDGARVFEEFRRVAEKKTVGAKELDAIVASVALQVPPTYHLANYVVNTGNIISATAQVTLEKAEGTVQGFSIGDGPIDAAFRAVEQIIGRHFELDDFQIQAVTEGKEAVGSALVRLRAGGKLYSGNGISTDIIGASVRAYLGAVNKILYEEA